MAAAPPRLRRALALAAAALLAGGSAERIALPSHGPGVAGAVARVGRTGPRRTRRRVASSAMLLALLGGARADGGIFGELDADGDGDVSIEEFRRAVREEMSQDDPEFERWFDTLFARADLDGTGTLNKAETELMMEYTRHAFVAAGAADAETTQRLNEEAEAEAEEAFRELDTNSDGRIEVDELVKSIEALVHEELDEGSRGDLALMFARCDLDGDGYLDSDEVMLMRVIADDAMSMAEDGAEQRKHVKMWGVDPSRRKHPKDDDGAAAEF